MPDSLHTVRFVTKDWGNTALH